MSILIKGLKMPEKGRFIDVVILDDGTVVSYDDQDRKIAEAIELPPHGDLIDKDKLIFALEMQDYSCAPETLEDWTPMDMTKAEIADLRCAPVVVPAERSEDGEVRESE